jgi:hypothetical protein
VKALKIGSVIVAGLVCLPILLFGFFEGRKSYWDWKVGQLCATDGGIKVFESIQLPDSEFALYLNTWGKLAIPFEKRAPEKVSIVQNSTQSYIHRNDPEVRRDEMVIYRRSDQKVLARSVIYSRVGGDLVAIHPSYFMCPENRNQPDIFAAVIRKGK